MPAGRLHYIDARHQLSFPFFSTFFTPFESTIKKYPEHALVQLQREHLSNTVYKVIIQRFVTSLNHRSDEFLLFTSQFIQVKKGYADRQNGYSCFDYRARCSSAPAEQGQGELEGPDRR